MSLSSLLAPARPSSRHARGPAFSLGVADAVPASYQPMNPFTVPPVSRRVREQIAQLRTKWEPLAGQPLATPENEEPPDGAAAYAALTSSDWDRIETFPPEGTVRGSTPDITLQDFFTDPDHLTEARVHGVSSDTEATRTRAKILFSTFQEAHREWTRYPYLHVGEPYHEYPWYPFRVETMDGPTSIYSLLAYRIFQMSKMEANKDLPQPIRHAAVLWNNAHIPLAIFIMEHGPQQASDQALTTPRDDLHATPLQMFGPHLDQIFHQGTTPDLTHLLVQVPFWNERTSEKRHPLVHVLYKVMPYRCTVRCLATILRALCTEDDLVGKDMIHMLLTMLATSYMGYADSSCSPHVYVRMRIVQQLLVHPPPKEEILRWLKSDVQQLLYYVIKEHVWCAMSTFPPMYHVMQRHYNWDRLGEHTTRSMDAIRTSFNSVSHHFHPLRMRYAKIREFLTMQSKDTVQDGPFHAKHRHPSDFATTCCDEIDDRHYPRFFRHPYQVEMEKKQGLMEQLRTTIFKTDPNEPLDVFQTLTAFDIPPSIARQQHDSAQTVFQTSSGLALENALRQLAAQPETEKEYVFVRAYWNLLHTHTHIQLLPLPQTWLRRQQQALRRRINLPPDEPVLSNKLLHYVCENCHEFTGFLVGNDPRDSNVSGHGNLHVCVDPTTMELYCGRKTERSSGKRRNHPGTIAADCHYVVLDPAKKARSTAKEARKAARKKRCSDTRLTTVELIGSILCVFDRYYLLCPGCACPMVFSELAYFGSTILCGPCLAAAQKTILIQNRHTCILCSNEQQLQPPEGKRPRRRPHGTWHEVQVLDTFSNPEEPPVQRNVWFCDRCHRPWIHNQGPTLSLRDILEGIEQKWGTVYIRDEKNQRIAYPRPPTLPKFKPLPRPTKIRKKTHKRQPRDHYEQVHVRTRDTKD